MKQLKIIPLIFLMLASAIYAQDNEVIEQLKNIEKGNIKDAVSSLSGLKNKYPGNPSVLFLEAVLTGSGEKALQIYKTVYEKYPKSTFADASLYRVFSYYYAAGLYKKAEETLKKLKTDYPASPYIQAADRTIPEESLPEQKPAQEAMKETVKEPAKASPAKADSALFTIQAGAFLNIQNAQSLKKNLETDGFPSEITTKEVGGSMLNVVLAGKFRTEKEADSFLVHIEKKYRLKGRIVPINK